MTEQRDSLQWLRDANTGWHAEADRQRERADSAEKWAAREHQEHLGAQRSAYFWRTTAVTGYAWLTVLALQTWWHCPRWTPIPVVIGAAVLNRALLHWQWARARRRAANDG